MTSTPTLSADRHRWIDLAMGATLLATPLLLLKPRHRFSLAGLVPVVMGAGMLVQRNRTRYRETSATDSTKLGLRDHLVADSLAGAALAFSPWILGFSRRAWLPHVLLGLTEIGVALLTRYGRQGRTFGQAAVDRGQQAMEEGSQAIRSHELSAEGGKQTGNGGRSDQSNTDKGRSGHGQTYRDQLAADYHGMQPQEVITDEHGLHGTGGGTLSPSYPQSSQSDPEWNAAPMANIGGTPATSTGNRQDADEDLTEGTDQGFDDMVTGLTPADGNARAAQNRDLTASFNQAQDDNGPVDDDTDSTDDLSGGRREPFATRVDDDTEELTPSVSGTLGSGEREDEDPSSVDSPVFGGGESRSRRSRRGAGAIARGPSEGQAREAANDDEGRPPHTSDEDVPGTL